MSNAFGYTVVVAGLPEAMAKLTVLPGTEDNGDFRIGHMLELLEIRGPWVDAQIAGKVTWRGPTGLIAEVTSDRYQMDGLVEALSAALPDLTIAWSMVPEADYLSCQFVILQAGAILDEGWVSSEEPDNDEAAEGPDDETSEIEEAFECLKTAAQSESAEELLEELPGWLRGEAGGNEALPA